MSLYHVHMQHTSPLQSRSSRTGGHISQYLHPHDSSQVWNLLSSPTPSSHKNSQSQQQQPLPLQQQPQQHRPRHVPRPSDSTQMQNTIRTVQPNGLLPLPLVPDLRSDAELRCTSEPLQTVEYPELTLKTLPSHTKIKRRMQSNLVASNPLEATYCEPPRVGDQDSLWNIRRDPIAKKGFVKSNLPTLVGCLGLETLNASLIQIPQTTHTNNPSAAMHPTYLSKQQHRCLEDERVHTILSTLRNQSHRPTHRYVVRGQGTAREIARENALQDRERRREHRLAFVDKALYSPIKSDRKNVVDDTEWVSGSSSSSSL